MPWLVTGRRELVEAKSKRDVWCFQPRLTLTLWESGMAFRTGL